MVEKTAGEVTKAVAIKTEGKEITITLNDVKRYLCPLASDAEIGLFLKVCASEGLNPFKKEVYLIKYASDQAASIIIATEVFLKAAENCPEYDGAEAGIILKEAKGQLEFREGSFLLDDEEDTLVGGWAKVYRKDRQRPIYSAVNIKEYRKFTRGGRVTRFWDEMPATMIRKVALSHALREAFPNRFAGTYTTAEVEELPEGKLPPALEKDGKPNWKKFWVRVKSELGLSTEQARELLQVDSIKEELIDTGWTMERIWDELTSRLHQRTQAEKAEVQPIKPKETNWDGFWEHAEQLGLSQDQVHEMLGVTTVKEWTDQGKTLDEAIEVVSKKLSQQEATRLSGLAGEDFNIDLEWLKESQKTLKWGDETMVSFIRNMYKVTGKTVTEVLGKLGREQAEDFVKEINSRREKQTSLF